MASTDNVKMAQLQYFGQEFKKEEDKLINEKATKATTLAGYGITDAMTTEQVNTELGKKANSSSTLSGYGITDAMTTEQVNVELNKKATKSTTLAGYGIADAYTTDQVDAAIASAVSNSQHLKKVIASADEIAAFETNPSSADANTIYLLKDNSATGEDKYKEYTVIGNAFVCTGSTSTDLSGFVKTKDLTYATNEDVDAAIAAIFGTTRASE